MKSGSSLLVLLCSVGSFFVSAYSSPRLLVLGKHRDEIVKKVETVDGAKASFEKLKGEVDVYLNKVENEPDWVTGDERYAELSAPILWTYMYGVSFVQPLYVPDEDKRLRRIIGSATYEVIHDGIAQYRGGLGIFLRDYIKERDDMDGPVIERGIKIFVDRIIAGGGRRGIWNLHQTTKIAYGGLVLDSNDS